MAVEYIQFNDPDDRRYSQVTEVVLNFLFREVLDEPYNPFPSEPTPLLYGAVDDGRLVAAASVSLHRDGDRQLMVDYLGVASDRRGEGLGSELLRRVEAQAVELGTLAIVAYPLDGYQGNAHRFFLRCNYVDHSYRPSGLVVKTLLPGTEQRGDGDLFERLKGNSSR